MCKEAELSQILSVFIKNAKEIFGDKLCDVILFGSYARGDFHSESDIDIMLIADISCEDVMKYLYSFSDPISELSLDYDVVISPVIEPLERYEKYKDVIPFLRNVQKEGIRIAS